MGCGGCGSSGILPGSLSVRNRVKGKRVRGYSGGGIIKAQSKLLKEAQKAEVVKEMQEASKVSK